MTTTRDDLQAREQSEDWGEARNQTTGVPIDGFSDPTGEYPARDYWFGGSINHVATGARIESITFGSEGGINLKVSNPLPAIPPFAQVHETPGGHVIIVDDTPGNERIVVKHATGAGVQINPDGSVISKSVGDMISHIGDDNTVLVQGNGRLVYRGDLSISVDGNFNVDVSGDYNVNVAGNHNQTIFGSHRSTIGKHWHTSARGGIHRRTAGAISEIALDDITMVANGGIDIVAPGGMEIATGSFRVSSNGLLQLTSASRANVLAPAGSFLVNKGTIGGEEVDHWGKAYSGPPGNGADVVFYGSLVGQAAEAITAKAALYATEAYYATASLFAMDAAKANAVPSTPTAITVPKNEMLAEPDFNVNLEFYDGDGPGAMPTGDIIGGLIEETSAGVLTIKVDDNDNTLLNSMIHTDNYAGVFAAPPTIHQIRDKWKDYTNSRNGKLVATLIGEGRLSPTHANTEVPEIEEVVGNAATGRFGATPLGNNPVENRSKIFVPNKQ